MEQKNIAKKLLVLMNEIGRIKKDKENKAQGYRYVSSDTVLSDVQAACVQHSVASYCEMSIDRVIEQTTKGGVVNNLVFVRCALHVIDQDSGEEIVAHSLGEGTDYGDKAAMKAATAAHKYAWLETLNISTGDDPEADEETDKPAPIKAVKRDNQFARDNFQETRKPDPDFHDGEQTKLITITNVKIEKKKSKQGNEYQKFTVIDENGNAYETIDRKLGAWCDTKTGFPVEITYEYNAQFKQNNLKSAYDPMEGAGGWDGRASTKDEE